ncbi:MAG: helix-turn-helix transcriptional regulator [Clostridia bacterium]|nr:helix-turn-helix transcriptional regulator [Clostridia bacterium]
MAVSYKKLWKLLIEKDMNKTDLRLKAGISTVALAKLGKNENVNTEILVKICQALECGVEDIMEISPSNEQDLDFTSTDLFVE